MVDKIEMSLEDIIKSTKTPKRGGAAGPRRGGRGGSTSFRGGNNNNAGGVRRQSGGRGDGGVQKGRNRGGGIAKPKFSRVR